MQVFHHFIIYFIVTIFTLVSCKKESEIVSEPTTEEAAKVTEIGTNAAKQLLDTLKTTLVSTIKDKGAVEAIKVCQVEALPMTIAIAKSSDNDLEIKRITTKARNQGNMPDNIEAMALEKYETLFEQNQPLPEDYIQKVTKKDKVYFNYYKPLKVAKVCLTCHGNPEEMNTDILDVLNNTYPNDKATGYNEEDFRGLVRVKITL